MKNVICALALAGLSGSALAGEVFNQGFESDTNGWIGSATRTLGGSSSGSYHANVTSNDFTRFDGYRSAWTGGFTASADIYLDTGWNAGEGFNYSVAANGSDGNHQRDFIFHVTKDTSTGQILVAADNNGSVVGPREDIETSYDNYEAITDSGWYTFEHVFYDFGDGTLAVDLNLYDSSDNLVFSETRNSSADILGAEVGGNRYGWFNVLEIGDGLRLDNVTLSVVPLPPAALAGLGLLGGLVGVRKLRQR